MKRRKFLETIPPVGLGLFVVPNLTLCSSPDQGKLKGATRVPLSVIGSSAKISTDKRIAFGWSPYILNADDIVLLKSNKLPQDAHVFLRITVALEMWDQAILQVFVPDEGETQLGILDIRHSSVLVPYELKIDNKHIPLINKYGIKVKLLTSKPFGFFEQSSTEVSNNVFTPHLLLSSSEKGTVPDFLNCFMSIDSVQAFGWREGTRHFRSSRAPGSTMHRPATWPCSGHRAHRRSRTSRRRRAPAPTRRRSRSTPRPYRSRRRCAAPTTCGHPSARSGMPRVHQPP